MNDPITSPEDHDMSRDNHVSLDSHAPTGFAGIVPARRIEHPSLIGGRYRLFDRIGGGGMADVYMADDEQLGTLVAVKVLKPDLSTPEMRARMIQEGRLAAAVQHPNMVRVYAVDCDGPTTYIAMELLRGASLEQYLLEQPDQRLGWRDAIRLLTPAMEALHAVHLRGYVHRDVKPTNLFVPAAGTRCEGAVVLDLGIVHRDPALRTDHAPPPTETGRVLGTPAYMSPEQAGAGGLDPRSDVYSFAATLYRALVGRPPFVTEEGKGVLLAKHIYESPTPMQEAAPTARIPRAIAEVVHGALAKDVDARPPTMQAFAAALRRAARVSDASVPTRRATQAVAVGFAGGLLLGAVGALGLAANGAPGPSVAAAPTVDVVPPGPRTAPTTLQSAEGRAPEQTATTRAWAARAGETTLAPVVPRAGETTLASGGVPLANPQAPAPSATTTAATLPSSGAPQPGAASEHKPGARRTARAADITRFLVAHQDDAAAACATGLGGAEVRVPVRVHFTHGDRPPTITLGERTAMFAGTCLVRELRGLRFPRAAGGTVVDHTFTLRPGTST